MAEPSDVAQLSRRAGWVGLRTLRQRPKLIQQTADGEPVFEIRSVRLVLRGNATHFTRLVECSKCGRDVHGAPVLGPADLDQPAHAVICKDCVRRATQRPSPPARRVREAPLVEAHPAVTGDPVAGASAVSPPRSRLDALETQLGAVLARLDALAEAQRSGMIETIAEVRAEMAEARDEFQVRVDARLDALTAAAGADADRLQTLEQKVQESLRRMTRLVGAQAHRPAEPPVPATTVGPHPTSLVDGLELQLQEAEARLAERLLRTRETPGRESGGSVHPY